MELTSVGTGLALAASLVCATAALLATRVVAAGLWLAGTSACVAAALFMFSAPYVAVMELSVGAGLVAVLVVFTVANDVDDGLHGRPDLHPWLAGTLAALVVGALALLIAGGLPTLRPVASVPEGTFAQVFWQERGLDALAQLVLLFVAALAVVALVGRVALPVRTSARRPVDAAEPLTEREEVPV